MVWAFGLNDPLIRVRCLKSVQICDSLASTVTSATCVVSGNVGGVHPSVARASDGQAMHVPCSVVGGSQGWLWHQRIQSGPASYIIVLLAAACAHQLVQCTVLSCQCQTGHWGRVYRLELSRFI
jgi:hypothetical protein